LKLVLENKNYKTEKKKKKKETKKKGKTLPGHSPPGQRPTPAQPSQRIPLQYHTTEDEVVVFVLLSARMVDSATEAPRRRPPTLTTDEVR
jgi:hypothetical protein